MDDLTLVGVHEDGEHLLLVDGSGSRHRLKVDEALRAAVRRDRARLGQLQIEMENRLRPREIQARIRSGETAEEVAAAAGVPIEHIRRYEGPVLAEREFIASQARDVRVRRGTPSSSGGAVSGAATLGEVVADRLSQREVDPDDAAWDAWRADDGSWCVVVRFTAGGKQREARWTYDQSVRHVSPLEDEARWLTADEPPQQQQHRRLAPVRDRVYDVEAGGTARPVPEEPGSVDLLDTLRERRGRRSRPTAGGPEDIDPVREAIDSLMSRGELRARGERPDGVDRPDRPDRPERPERADRPERAERPARPEPVARVERVEAAPAAEAPPPPAPPPPEEAPAPRTTKRASSSRPEARRGAAKRQEPKRPAGRRPAASRTAQPAPDAADTAGDPPPAHPARSHPQDLRDGEVLVLPEAEPRADDGLGDDAAAQETGKAAAAAGGQTRRAATSRKPRRASVPSWDDIVFGQRRD
jgi:hypothetical protein